MFGRAVGERQQPCFGRDAMPAGILACEEMEIGDCERMALHRNP